MDYQRQYELRCPIHGFIAMNDWERQIISHPAFQRLRRIRQLAWTDQVYPGAMHTRFEHSLGVMHTASLLYDAVASNSQDVLSNELGYNDAGLRRHRQLVRLAALLHDVGHSPFSHASEELFPQTKTGDRFKHEHYSAAIIRDALKEVIEEHSINTSNYGIRADDVAALIEGSAEAKQGLFWKDLISSQLDADRMDYLLRDAYHTGVGYGRFDLQRLISTVIAIPGGRGKSPKLGIEEGGWHAAEALVVARYLMFTQVYFHKTRIAYDIHIKGAMKAILPGGEFPSPEGKHLNEYLGWDDWKVLGKLAAGEGGEHGRRLCDRNHYREVYHTAEVCTLEENHRLDKARTTLGSLLVAEQSATTNWYKLGKLDITVASKRDLYKEGGVKPLSHHSKIIESMKSNNQVLLYVKPEDKDKALEKLGGAK